MPKVLITPTALLGVDGPWVSRLKDAGFEIVYPEDREFARGLSSEAETARVMNGVSAVLAGGEHFTPNVISAVPTLRVIARAGVGYDRVNVAAATAGNIPVTITPTANHEGVAEQVFAMLFAVAKSVLRADQVARSGKWPLMLVRPVRGTTLGIFGLGRIGRSVAIRGRALGMRVIAAEVFPDQSFVKQHGVEIVDFDTLLVQSDYLSIHCPLAPETKGLFNRDVFSRMKRGSVLINSARGGVVVERDLVEALQSGHLFGAGLDVFEVEPTPVDNPLFQCENVVLAPHIAGADTLTMEKMACEAADCIARLYEGDWPTGCVINEQIRENWKW